MKMLVLHLTVVLALLGLKLCSAAQFVDTCGSLDDNTAMFRVIGTEFTSFVRVTDEEGMTRPECKFDVFDSEYDNMFPHYTLNAQYRKEGEEENGDGEIPCLMESFRREMNETTVIHIYVLRVSVQENAPAADIITADERLYTLKCVFEQFVDSVTPLFVTYFPHVDHDHTDAMRYSIYLIDIRGHRIVDEIPVAAYVRLQIELEDVGEDLGFHPLECRIIGDRDHSAPTLILSEGCGTGFPFQTNQGFKINGSFSTSRPFQLTSFNIGSEVAFSCNIHGCTEHECPLNSCDIGDEDYDGDYGDLGDAVIPGLSDTDRNITILTTGVPTEDTDFLFPEDEKADEMETVRSSANIAPLATVAIVLAIVFIACMVVVIYLAVRRRHGEYHVQR